MTAKPFIDENFKHAVAKGVTLVDFKAPWCGPCRAQEPILRELEGRYRGRATVTAIDIDTHQELAFALGIQSIPTIIIFKDGMEKKRFIGLQSGTTLSDARQPYVDRRAGRHEA
jgi:thioredoxin 1